MLHNHTTIEHVYACQTLCQTFPVSSAAAGALRRHLKRFADELKMRATEEVESLVLSMKTGTLRNKAAPDAPVQVGG